MRCSLPLSPQETLPSESKDHVTADEFGATLFNDALFSHSKVALSREPLALPGFYRALLSFAWVRETRDGAGRSRGSDACARCQFDCVAVLLPAAST